MNPVILAFISVLLLFILIFTRMPVAFVMLLIGMGGYAIVVSPQAAFTITVQTLYSNFSSYSSFFCLDGFYSFLLWSKYKNI